MKKLINEVLVTSCVCYTIISLVLGRVNVVTPDQQSFYGNLVMMFVWTAIAVAVLYAHTLFERWPPVLVMLVQYVLAMGLVLLLTWLTGFFGPLHPLWYWYAFRSFTGVYVVGAAAFYIETFRQARKTDALLQQLRQQK